MGHRTQSGWADARRLSDLHIRGLVTVSQWVSTRVLETEFLNPKARSERERSSHFCWGSKGKGLNSHGTGLSDVLRENSAELRSHLPPASGLGFAVPRTQQARDGTEAAGLSSPNRCFGDLDKGKKA